MTDWGKARLLIAEKLNEPLREMKAVICGYVRADDRFVLVKPAKTYYGYEIVGVTNRLEIVDGRIVQYAGRKFYFYEDGSVREQFDAGTLPAPRDNIDVKLVWENETFKSAEAELDYYWVFAENACRIKPTLDTFYGFKEYEFLGYTNDRPKVRERDIGRQKEIYWDVQIWNDDAETAVRGYVPACSKCGFDHDLERRCEHYVHEIRRRLK